MKLTFGFQDIINDDAAQVEALKQTLAEKGYVWRDLLVEFVASDAFRSAPAVIAGDQ